MTLQQALEQWVAGKNISREAMRAVMMTVMTGEATEAQIGALLVALRMKGEAIDEITGAAEVMRELVTPVVVEDSNLSILSARAAMAPTSLTSRQPPRLLRQPPARASQNMETDRSPAAAGHPMFWRRWALILP